MLPVATCRVSPSGTLTREPDSFPDVARVPAPVVEVLVDAGRLVAAEPVDRDALVRAGAGRRRVVAGVGAPVPPRALKWDLQGWI